MTRRFILPLLIAAFFTPAIVADDRPNIVYVLADDK